MTAGLYASRAGMRTVLLERMMSGGQIVNADKIENLPGFPEGISGSDLGLLVQDQATKYGWTFSYPKLPVSRRTTDRGPWRLMTGVTPPKA